MRGVAGGDEGGGDGVSTNMPIAPRDTSDGRVCGLVIFIFRSARKSQFCDMTGCSIFLEILHYDLAQDQHSGF